MIQSDHRDLHMHKFGSKPGKMLSYLTKEAYTPVAIPKMKTTTGDSVTEPKAINKIFETFYQNLYVATNSDSNTMKTYLSSMELACCIR